MVTTVLWATSADACSRLRAAGIEAAEAGLTDADIAPVRAEMRRSLAGVRPEDLPTVVFPLLFGETRTPPMLEALLPLAREWQPDLVVHEQGELAGPLVATLLGVPHAVHAFGGGIPAPILAETADRLAGLWSEHGQQVPPYAGCYQHLYVDICPASLQTVPLDHVGAVQAARPELYSVEDPATVPALTARGRRPAARLRHARHGQRLGRCAGAGRARGRRPRRAGAGDGRPRR